MAVFIYRKSGPNLPLLDIKQLDIKDALWVDLFQPNKDEEETIESAFKIDIVTEAELRGMEESARFFEENGNLYLGIDSPARIGAVPYMRAPEDANYTRAALSFVLTPTTLISFRENAFRALEIGHSRASARLEGVSTAADALMAVCDAIVERQADLLANMGREVDLVSVPVLAEKQLIRAEPRLKKLGALGAQLSLCRDCLYDLGRMMHFLTQHQTKFNFDKDRLGDLREDILALQRQCEAQSGDLSFLLDATLGLVGARQSQALNFMAVVTLLFAPPTLLAGVFGMNFINWGFFNHGQGHLLAFGMMGLSSLIVILIARFARLI